MADAVVLATGGMSYPGTGSTGDGYRLAERLGHMVVSPRAALVPIEASEKWCAELMGLSLKNVTLTLKNAAGKAVFSEMGEMLFTHFGVSGPLVLSASSYIKEDPGAYRIEIDLKPALNMQQLDARLLRDFAENRNRDFINALDRLLPRKLIPVAVRLVRRCAGEKGAFHNAGRTPRFRGAFEGAAGHSEGVCADRAGSDHFRWNQRSGD